MSSTALSLTSAFKSPEKMKLSQLKEWISIVLLIASKCEDVFFVGIVRILFAWIKLSKKAFSGCLFYRNKSCVHEQQARCHHIFVALNSEGFAKTFKSQLIYKKNVI